jgi:hypothetical protein
VTQLQPNGLLLVEEVERIQTTNVMFSSYLEILETLLAPESRALYLGPRLHALDAPDGLMRQASRVRRLRVSNSRAATMFRLNMQAWKTEPSIRENYSGETLDRLEQDLSAMSQSTSPESEIEWELRQIAFERA